MFWRGYQLKSEWTLYGLSQFDSITFPPLSARQKQIAHFALQFIGYPYVWPASIRPRTPLRLSAAGGSTVRLRLLRDEDALRYNQITVNDRGAHDMAADAKPRITRKNLTCGDSSSSGPTARSRRSRPSTTPPVPRERLVHPVHGSTDGVSLASLDSSTYWKNAFAWGRRLLTPPSSLRRRLLRPRPHRPHAAHRSAVGRAVGDGPQLP